MKKFTLLSLIGCLVLSVGFDASASEIMSLIRKNKAQYVSDSQEFQKAMHQLLARNWSLGSARLTVNHNTDASAELSADFKVEQLRSKTISRSDEIIPEEIGVVPGYASDRVYAGPFVIGSGAHRFTFLVTVDDRPWGYADDRYFLIYRKSNDDGAKASTVEMISHDLATEIKEGAEHPLPSGFVAITDQGKEILNRFSAKKWQIGVRFGFKHSYLSYNKITKEFERVEETEYQEWYNRFHFEFWNDFKRVNYSMAAKYDFTTQTIGPFQNLPLLFGLGERTLPNGIHEYVIMAGNNWAMFQSSNRADFIIGNPAFFKAKTWAEAEVEYERKVTGTVCYDGHDCSKVNNPAVAHQVVSSIGAGAVILQIDESKPDELNVRYELTHPLFEGVVNQYKAE